MTEEQAVEFADSKWWESVPLEEAAMWQLFEDRLCMPFGTFHEGVEKLLGRSVWTHEFGLAIEGLRSEALGKKQKPSLADILALIPEEKRVVIAL